MYQILKTVCTIFGIILFCIGTPVGRTESAFSAPQQESVSAIYPKEISVKQAASKKVAGAYILDVRELHEFVQGHVPGAVMIPLNQLKDRVNELPKDKEIVVICFSGGRSMIGLEILRKAGYEKSSSLAGGMGAWKTAGYPTKIGR